MSVGARIKEERLRLSLSQPAFAALAGATKSALVKWEKDESSPNAKALIAWAEAGADPLYILTGRRTFDLPINLAPYIEAQLAMVRHDIIDPDIQRRALPGESPDQTDKRLMEWHANVLSGILSHDTQLLPGELSGEVVKLLALVTDPEQRSTFRAEQAAERRAERRSMKREVAIYLHETSYVPGDAVRTMLADIALDYRVPLKVLIGLVDEINDEFVTRIGDGLDPSTGKG